MEDLNHPTDYDALLKPSKMSIFLTIVMWLGIIVTLIWATLKTFGYINTPPWQESLPFYALAITLAGGIYKFGQDMGDLKHATRSMGKDMRTMTHRQNNMAQALVHVETNMSHMSEEFKGHMSRYHRRV